MVESESVEKEDNTLLMLIEIVGVIILASVILGIGIKLGSTETITQTNIAEDLKLMINTLIAVPDDVIVAYPKDVSDYIVILESGSVSLFKSGEQNINTISKQFYLPEKYIAIGTIENEHNLCLEKKEFKLILRKCKLEENAAFSKFRQLLRSQNGEIYSYDSGIEATPIYYTYMNNHWKWSPDQENWMLTNITKVSSGNWNGKKPVSENIELINFLENFNPNPEEFK